MSMQNHKNMNVANHFLAEAMIIFLIAVPFMEYKYQWIPYWRYLGLILAICLLFSAYTKYRDDYAWYIWTVPFLVVVFYVSGFSIFLSVLFPVLLTFRYIYLRKDSALNRGMAYINLTVVLTIFLLIWIKDISLVIYAFFILTFLLVGHILSHFMAIKQSQSDVVKRKLWMTIATIFGISTTGLILLYMFRNIFTGIWTSVMSAIGYVGGKFGVLVGYILPDIEPTEEKENEDPERNEAWQEQNENMEDKLPDQNGSSLLEDYGSIILWGMGVVILIALFILAFRYTRSRFNEPGKTGDTQEVVTYSDLDDVSALHKTSLFNRFFQAPEHQVRKLIFLLERDAAKVNAGRLSCETLDSWLERLGFTIDMSTYNKVRYGNVENVSDEEVQTLKKHLKHIRDYLKKEQKNRKRNE